MPRPLILSAFLLVGCASAPVIEKPVAVEVVRDNYVSLPQDLLAPCPNLPAPLNDGDTVGSLWTAWFQYQYSWAPCMQKKLEAIKALQP
jgi:hypothetical protein